MDWKDKVGFVWIVFLLAVFFVSGVGFISSMFDAPTENVAQEEIDSNTASDEYSEYLPLTRDEVTTIIARAQIKSVQVDEQDIYMDTIDDGKYVYHDKYNLIMPLLEEEGYTPLVIEKSDTESEEDSPKKTYSAVFKVMVPLLIVAVIVTVYLFGMEIGESMERKRHEAMASKESSSTSKTPSEKESLVESVFQAESKIPEVKFSDVEGIEELKKDINVLVDSLKNPEKYNEIGARTPKGVILYGPPGTGKTLIAKAIAGEAGVPFFSAVGSDFVEMYVGVGAKRVRELYTKARKNAPCIVFIDEVDAVASKRGDSDTSAEKNQTVNALLAELDGFTEGEQIITICTTNRLDMLDSAFTRAGRFDLKLAVGLPDKEGRKKILRLHSANKKLATGVNLEEIASRTVGFSGADLEALLNEAAIIAVGKNRPVITRKDIDDAFFKIVMHGNKKPRKGTTELNKIIAWHEAGHVLATKLLTDDSVSSVTIVGSSSGAGGVTFRNPKEEMLHSKKYMRNLISVMYAGRAAEEIYQGDSDLITDGASQDIKQATGVIKEYLAMCGMGDIGMLDISQLRPDYQDIVPEASALSKEIYNSTLDILKENKKCLEELATRLLEKETLYEEEIDNIIAENKA